MYDDRGTDRPRKSLERIELVKKVYEHKALLRLKFHEIRFSESSSFSQLVRSAMYTEFIDQIENVYLINKNSVY